MLTCFDVGWRELLGFSKAFGRRMVQLDRFAQDVEESAHQSLMTEPAPVARFGPCWLEQLAQSWLLRMIGLLEGLILPDEVLHGLR